jgi:hypothetical protein
MSDFDITTFRSKPKKKTGKRKSLRDATKVSTPFIEYLEKRTDLQVTEIIPNFAIPENIHSHLQL